MTEQLQTLQPSVKSRVELFANDPMDARTVALRMSQPTEIHQNKEPRRKHYIPEWAEVRGLTQADIIRDCSSHPDKGTVSRWFAGETSPQKKHLEPLAALFELENPLDLFRHPDDDWITRFFRNRSLEERKRIKNALENLFPEKLQNSQR